MRRKKRVKKVSAKRYSAMLKQMAGLKKKGLFKQWMKLRTKAKKARVKMISRNFTRLHPADRTATPQYRNLYKEMPADYRAALKQATKNRSGKSALKRYRTFWKIPLPPEIREMDLGPLDRKFPHLVGMGRTPEVHLAAEREMKRGTSKRAHGRNPGTGTRLRGSWMAATDTTGRHILLLSGKKIRGPFRFVGYAPETHYIPTVAMENAGTFKKNKHWRHLHNDDGGVWPEVFADRNGKIDRNSNFIYGKGTYRIGQWIRR